MREAPKLTDEELKELRNQMTEEEKIRSVARILAFNRLSLVQVDIEEDLLPYMEKGKAFLKELDDSMRKNKEKN